MFGSGGTQGSHTPLPGMRNIRTDKDSKDYLIQGYWIVFSHNTNSRRIVEFLPTFFFFFERNVELMFDTLSNTGLIEPAHFTDTEAPGV